MSTVDERTTRTQQERQWFATPLPRRLNIDVLTVLLTFNPFLHLLRVLVKQTRKAPLVKTEERVSESQLRVLAAHPHRLLIRQIEPERASIHFKR